ncbi:GcrA cell cycle regulator [Bradyrhizobium sp. 76]|nr:GcrA cell cycle regulator [Bradyrhizobium sp. 76]
MRWNRRELAQLEKLWAAGQSAAQIARHLECSRNAVCGRLARLASLEVTSHQQQNPRLDPPRSEGRRRWRLVAIASERSCRKRR